MTIKFESASKAVRTPPAFSGATLAVAMLSALQWLKA
jgi:hypothetical protein